MPQQQDDLQRHRAIACERVDGSTTPWRFIAADGRSASRTINHALAFGNSEAQLSAVIAELGVAQMATWLPGGGAGGQGEDYLPQLMLDGLPLNLVWPAAAEGRCLAKRRCITLRFASSQRR